MTYLKFVLVLIFVLFILIVMGMRTYEGKINTLYKEHILLLENFASKPSQEAMDKFIEKIDLSPSEEFIIMLSTAGQKSVDFLTFGTPHCFSENQKNCRMYLKEVVDSAQLREIRLKSLTRRSINDPVADAKIYKWYELVLKAFTLLVEASLIYLAIVKIRK